MRHDVELKPIKCKSTMRCDATVIDSQSRSYIKYAIIPLCFGLFFIFIYVNYDLSEKWNEVLKIIISVTLGVFGVLVGYLLVRRSQRIYSKK